MIQTQELTKTCKNGFRAVDGLLQPTAAAAPLLLTAPAFVLTRRHK